MFLCNMKLVILVLFLLHHTFGEMDRTWWKNTIFYQVYLPSFKDSNGDGMGDLKGLTSKLNHFVESGVDTIYITPHYESPMEDGGYDVSDFTAVNPMLGTLEDFNELVVEAKSRGLKVVIDIIINHTSGKHQWFAKSIDKQEPYTNYYVWKDAKNFVNGKPVPPNNWVSVFGGSAWTWNEKRQQFYYHQFTQHQPDLNLRNKAVKTEIKKIFKFWLDRGVAGFRLDAVKYLFEDEQFRDEPLSSPDIVVPHKPTDVIRLYTTNVWETYKFIHDMRGFMDRASQKFGDYERIFVPEVYGQLNIVLKYFDRSDYKITQLPLNFALATIGTYENAAYFHNLINVYLNALPAGATPSWNSENHDKLRKANFFTKEYAFIYTTMVMMLPGVGYVYYGQEIGMVGSRMRSDQQVDKYQDDITKQTRDIGRQPMQWDDSFNAGFSSNPKMYLPVNPEYWNVNVKTQKWEPNSHYNMFKKMVNLRKTDTLKYGDFKSYVLSTWVFAFTRTLKDSDTYLVVVNLGSETEIVDLSNSIPNLPQYMKVEVASSNSGYKPGNAVPTVSSDVPNVLVLRPSATLVLSSQQSGLFHSTRGAKGNA